MLNQILLSSNSIDTSKQSKPSKQLLDDLFVFGVSPSKGSNDNDADSGGLGCNSRLYWYVVEPLSIRLD